MATAAAPLSAVDTEAYKQVETFGELVHTMAEACTPVDTEPMAPLPVETLWPYILAR